MRSALPAKHHIFLLGLLGLAGCASIPPDLGRNEVNTLVAERGRVVDAGLSTEALEELVASLTSAPLEPETAVRLALVNNPQLTAVYATLGFGAADLYEAARIRNPVFAGEWLDPDVAGEQRQVTLGLIVSFTDLITLRARKRLGTSAHMALKQSIGAEVLTTAAHAERVYYEYVGAQQIRALRAQIAKAASLSAALAERFSDAGNISARELALERAAASEARLEALATDQEAFEARGALAETLGLSVGGNWDAREQLQLPANEEDDLNALLALATESRLDLAAARAEADLLADSLNVVGWTRWLGDFDVGFERERETDGARLKGPTVDWEVPIFDQHKDALLRTEAELQIAIADVQRLITDVDNSVRLAYAAVENASARVREHRDVLIPERIEAVARAQEEVNFMLIGVFELINIKQEEYDAYQSYLEAVRDYWLARVDLRAAVGNALPSDAAIADQRIDVDDFIGPPSDAVDHSMHDHSGMRNGGTSDGQGMDHSQHEMMDHNSHGPDAGGPADESQDQHGNHDHGNGEGQ